MGQAVIERKLVSEFEEKKKLRKRRRSRGKWEVGMTTLRRTGEVTCGGLCQVMPQPRLGFLVL